jgi:hypothetical protein
MNFQEIILIKTVKSVILLTTAEINRAPQTELIQNAYYQSLIPTDAQEKCFKWVLKLTLKHLF